MRPISIIVLTLLLAPAAMAASSGRDAGEMLIPVAGHVPGAGGETFVTDLLLVNFGDATQAVELTWLPRGGTAAPISETVTLRGHQFQNFLDVVATVFETEGLGAILIRSLHAPAAIDAQARIWTTSTCNTARGSLSQTVPAVVFDGWRNGSPAYVHGTRSDDQFRANYGIVNLDREPRQFLVIVNSNNGGRFDEIVTVPGNGILQKGAPTGARGDLSVYFEPLEQTGRWHGWAASVDNVTGSSWTVPAIQPRQDLAF